MNTITADKYGNTRIVVKNVRYSPLASQETNYYTASVYLDGERLGEARNEGQGGSTWCCPVAPGNRPKMKEAEEYAESLPSITYEPERSPTDFSNYPLSAITLDMSLELLIDSLAEEVIIAKSLKLFEAKMKRLCKTKVVLKEDGTYTTLNIRYIPELKGQLLKKYPEALIMNDVWGLVST